MRFCVVIVTYFPNERLLKQIKVLQKSVYVGHIIVVDNSAQKSNILALVNGNKVEILYNKRNEGIGMAQNTGIKKVILLGYKWVITFDQDTVATLNLFKKYHDFILTHHLEKIGIINTDYYDVGKQSVIYNNKLPLLVDTVISSGSLYPTALFEKEGFFKEKYFIDQVDNEFCYRISKKGYKNVILPGNDMEHCLGRMGRCTLFGYQIYLYNQKPLRTYYRTRNILWMIREHRERTFVCRELCILVKDMPRILLETGSLLKLRMYFKGILDGLFKKEYE